MATNKHATIRYHALDKCFSNQGRKYCIEDLVTACNHELYEFTGKPTNVAKRQVYSDITFMESEQGWSIDLEKQKEGKRVYYRYSNSSFSIKKQPVNQLELDQIGETLAILSRFKGFPHFEWIEELNARLSESFKVNFDRPSIVGFESNPYLKGFNFFNELYQAILAEQSLSVNYKSFQELSDDFVFHPWYLKQYNNRWFVLGLHDRLDKLSILALDRIQAVTRQHGLYKPNTNIDFEEFFEDVIGVTVNEDVEPLTIRLMVDKKLWPYIESKPIHGSQKVVEKHDHYTLIELNVQVNYELMALLFSFQEQVEVVGPESFREVIKDKIEILTRKYH